MTIPPRGSRQNTSMKRIFIIVAGALVLAVTPLRSADALTEALQKGLFEEEANQNLDAAIKAYQDVLSRADEQRRVAATALFRLAECYRKQGKTNEASAEYRRLVRDYETKTEHAEACIYIAMIGSCSADRPKRVEGLLAGLSHCQSCGHSVICS